MPPQDDTAPPVIKPAPARRNRVTCPRCHSFDVEPSRRRFLDAVRRRPGAAAYRCLSCWLRFFGSAPADPA